MICGPLGLVGCVCKSIAAAKSSWHVYLRDFPKLVYLAGLLYWAKICGPIRVGELLLLFPNSCVVHYW